MTDKESIFHRALEIENQDERASFPDRACTGSRICHRGNAFHFAAQTQGGKTISFAHPFFVDVSFGEKALFRFLESAFSISGRQIEFE